MPVISYNLPNGISPSSGTMAGFVTWLDEHVSPVTMYCHQYNLNVTDRTVFNEVLKEYETVIGTDWQCRHHINRMLVVRAEKWSLWQMTAQSRRFNGYNQSYQYAVYIEDEILALQFKLSCL
jgi:hypothetical protein